MLESVLAVIHPEPLAIIKAGGYLGITAVVFAESGILFGIFFPGDSLLFVAGLFAGTGLLSYPLLVTLVVVAAIAGDSVGYWFGRKVGPTLFSRPDSRFFKQAYLARAETFYATHGPRAVVLARFVPIVRTLAPILAGVGSMPYKRFLAYNVIGALLWGAGIISIGYFLGSAVPGIENYIFPITIGIIIVSFLPIIVNLLRAKRAA